MTADESVPLEYSTHALCESVFWCQAAQLKLLAGEANVSASHGGPFNEERLNLAAPRKFSIK